MPFRRRGSFGRRSFGLRPVNSIKNQVNDQAGITTAQTAFILINAVDSATTAVDRDVEKGCKVSNMYLTINCEGTGGSGVVNVIDIFLIKNPGNNLTLPGAKVWGTSNEKKFIFKAWRFLLPRVQDGNFGIHWEGWIKIPRIYQRFGTNDNLAIAYDTDVAANVCHSAIYKWYK